MSSSTSYKTESLITEYTDRLLRLALTIVGDYQIAEDVTQEAWLKIHHNLPAFRGDSSIYTWMARITINLAKNRMRPNFWSRVQAWREEYSEIIADHQPTADELLAIKCENANLLEALLQLPINQRTVLYFYYYEELKAVEIADLLDISNSAVKLRLMRGRQKLKELLLEQEGYKHE